MAKIFQAAQSGAAAVARPIARTAAHELAVAQNPEEKLLRRVSAGVAAGVGIALTARAVFAAMGLALLYAITHLTPIKALQEPSVTNAFLAFLEILTFQNKEPLIPDVLNPFT